MTAYTEEICVYSMERNILKRHCDLKKKKKSITKRFKFRRKIADILLKAFFIYLFFLQITKKLC